VGSIAITHPGHLDDLALKPRPDVLHQRRRDLGASPRPAPGHRSDIWRHATAGSTRPTAPPRPARPNRRRAASSATSVSSSTNVDSSARAAPLVASSEVTWPSVADGAHHLLVRDEHVAEHHLVEVVLPVIRDDRPDGHPGLAELDEQLG